MGGRYAIQRSRTIVVIAILGLFQSAAPHGAGAQSYPTRPITIIVPYPAGGPSDVLTRILAERLKTALGQPIIIENVTGAGGSIGVGRVARSAPDGYTLAIGHNQTHVINGASMNLPYDVVKDFEPIVADRRHAAMADQPQDAAGQRREGADRLAQGQQGDRRLGRRRRADRSLRAVVPEADRHAIPVRALSRRRAAAPGPAGRPDRHRVRPGGELSRPGSQRPAQGLRGSVQAALVGGAGRADHGRGRRAGTARLVLARHVGAEGHAEGDHRQARRRLRRDAGRPRGAAAVEGHRPGASGPATNRRRRRWPRSRRTRSRYGGRSSRPTTSRANDAQSRETGDEDFAFGIRGHARALRAARRRNRTIPTSR